MFRLPSSPPSPKDGPHILADYIECLAWKQGHASAREVVAGLGRESDYDEQTGCEDGEDDLTNGLDVVMHEIERRKGACGEESAYPFRLEREGTVVRHLAKSLNTKAQVYRYLLLSTRLDMKKDRRHAGIDGAAMLEDLAASALRCYLGASRARSHVFGTAAPSGFKKRVNELCRLLGEGQRFRSLDERPVSKKDDRLDAVAWVPFSDKQAGQLIVFAQCKTGTSWPRSVTELQPEAFCKKWMQTNPVVAPVRAFCLSESVDRTRWTSTGHDAGLLFDRCRLVDFCDHVEPSVLKRIKRWTSAAKKQVLAS